MMDKVVVAVGGRSSYFDASGAKECCIMSDDIFFKFEVLGKMLCVGVLYILFEIVGFLIVFGFDMVVAIRSISLRGFD